MQVRVQQLGPGMMQQIQSVCHECQGQGERIDPKHRCKTCNGRKVNSARCIHTGTDNGGPSSCIRQFHVLFFRSHASAKYSKYLLIKAWKMDRR